MVAALSDGSKVVVSAVPGYGESTRSWSEVLRDLRDRGLNCPQTGGRRRTPGDMGSASQRLAGRRESSEVYAAQHPVRPRPGPRLRGC